MIRLPLPIALLLSPVLISVAAFCETLPLRTLALQQGEMPEFFVKGEDGFVPVAFSHVQPGPVIRAERASPLPLYERRDGDDGKEAFANAHRIALPAGAGGILLLGWMDGAQFRYVAIRDDFGAAKFNDWLLINTGKRPVALQVGEGAKPVVVKPGTSVSHRVAARAGQGTSVIAQAPFDGEAKTFYSTFWPVREGRRSVVLFFDDGDRVRVKRISDALMAGADAG